MQNGHHSEQHHSKQSSAARLGVELRRSRLARGLSQRALTRRLGLSAHSNLGEYERAIRLPPRDLVLGWERVLGLAPGQLQKLYEEALSENADRLVNAQAAPGSARPRR